MKVSIIIPCYNVERYIEVCLNSVMNQDHKDIEVICVDDGSSDNTVQILKELKADAMPELKLIFQENAGAPKARNVGLEKASGQYFQFLDADDIISPKKISNQITLAEKFNLPDLVVGSYTRRTETGKVLVEKVYSEDYSSSSVFLHLMKTDLGITSSNLFHRKSFDDGLRWNVDLKSSQEYDLMFELLKSSNKVKFDNEDNTTIIERDSGSISKSNKSENWLRYTHLRLRIYQHLQDNAEVSDLNSAVQILFDAIRVLFGYNQEKAVELYNQFIPASFEPIETPTTGKLYVRLFKLFGFTKTEKIRSFLSK